MSKECKHGCGKTGKFQRKDGSWCCSNTSSNCEAIRAKNREGVKRAHKEGKCKSFNDAHRQITSQKRRTKVITDLLNNSTYRSNHHIKKYIQELNLLPWKCSCCGIDNWQGKNITLELDHIDGCAYNCKIENLRLLCPNCHSQTDTFRGKGINTGKQKVSDEQLRESIKNSKNIRQALIRVGLSPRGGNYTRASKLK